MFSGIIEATVPALAGEMRDGLYRLTLARPSTFTDIKPGDSIAVDGACLTVESESPDRMVFALAAESLKVLEWKTELAPGRRFNLERSLRFGDRLHGHLVSGHVDSLGKVTATHREGESLFIDIRIVPKLRALVWHKGSITLHGVSLTINKLDGDVLSVCLIPETQNRTNLGAVKVGDPIHVEPDLMARAVVRALENGWRPDTETKS